MLFPAPSLSDITSEDLQKEVDDEVQREERKQRKVGAGSLDKLSKEMVDLKADLESETGRTAQQVADEQIQMSAVEYAREAKARGGQVRIQMISTVLPQTDFWLPRFLC